MDFNPNDFAGGDSDRINQAVQAAAKAGGTARIASRAPDAASSRTHWLLDSAILLPAGANVVFENCLVKLSDRCRDNFMRSANCGLGIEDVRPISGIHVRGEGRVVFEGADRPRATGDSAKILGARSFGTDAGVEGECQTGDWRNIGILLAKVSDFSLCGLRIVNSHCWAVSLEFCSFGQIRSIDLQSAGWAEVDGERVRVMNQDGIDLRHGCHDIVIDTVTGSTGDDILALTALPSEPRPSGLAGVTEVCAPSADVRGDDIFNVVIRNVVGTSFPDGQTVRFLNNGGIRLHHVILDGVIDAPATGHRDYAAVRVGDATEAWGGVTPLGDTYGLVIRNVLTNARHGVLISGSLADSLISGVVSFNPDVPAVEFASGRDHVRNLRLDGLGTTERPC